MDLPLPASRFVVAVGDQEVSVSEVRDLAFSPDLEPAVTVTLRRAAGSDRTLLDWASAPKARAVRISLVGQGGRAAVSYLLEGARPTAWHGPQLGATSAGLAMEELVLVADRIDLRSA